jgi:hypothetical protein
MNKTVLALGTLALLSFAQPATAQMCGPGQQAQTTGGMSGGMCGMGQAADDPMADKPAQQTQRGGGMCPCCKNMAMMRGGMGGGGMQHHHMPGMEAPKPQ